MRVAIATWGSLGDLHPYMAIGLELQRRGHRVALATLPSFREHVEAAGLTFHPLRPDVDATDTERFRVTVRRLLDARDGPRYLFQEVLNPAMRETYEDTMAAVRSDGGADLVLSHQVPVTTPLVAEKTGTRWASGVLLPMAFLSAYDPPTAPQAPWLQPIAARHIVLARAMNRLGRRVTQPWIAPVHAFRQRLGLPRGGSPVFEGQHSPWLVLGLFSTLFAPPQPDYPPQTQVCGFAFYDAARERPPSDDLARFLGAGEPPVVFTLGSSAVWIAGDFYRTSIEAIGRLKTRAVLLAGEAATDLRRAVPDSIHVADYVPHGFLMPRASVVVHQGGVGTTAQALRSGKPMLVVPFGQDQPDNARRCVRLGVARTLGMRHYTATRLASDLDALRSDASYAANAARVGAAIASERGTEHAADALEAMMQTSVRA